MTERGRLAREASTARRTLVEDGAVGPPKQHKTKRYEILLHPIPGAARIFPRWMERRKPWRVGRYVKREDAEKALRSYQTRSFYVKYFTAELRER